MCVLRTDYIKRSYALDVLKNNLAEASKRVINTSEQNEAYEIGKNLGYTDALKECIKIVEGLPDEPKPTGQRPIFGRPSTFE